MWQYKQYEVENGIKYLIELNGSLLSYDEVIHLWKSNLDFRCFYINLLRDLPFEAYRWETPQVTINNANRRFEFVVLNDPTLLHSPDYNSFYEYFNNKDVVKFHNLGRDALLIAPCLNGRLDYSHLGAFMQNAPDKQIHSLLQLVGESMVNRVNNKPVWLNTAGTGVSWLHVRLDDRPKYYSHLQYKNELV